ncbi:MAG: hypothetical protein LBC71_08345 [Oscillospiraceae bacterium]|nr:hypothetical protein [Oscillospiraceae bacterium]
MGVINTNNQKSSTFKDAFKTIKDSITIAGMVLLAGIIGNFIAYVYKLGYFHGFNIPFSLIHISVYEAVLYSCVSLLYAISFLFIFLVGKPRKKELDKFFKKERHSKSQLYILNVINIMFIAIVFGFILFFITSNLLFAIAFPVVLALTQFIIFASNSSGKENINVRTSIETQIVDFKSKFPDIELPSKDELVEEQNIREDSIKKAATIIIVTLLFAGIIFGIGFLGYSISGNQTGFTVINTEKSSFLVVAEGSDYYICNHYYEGMNEITPEYFIVHKNDVISIWQVELKRYVMNR